MNVLPATAALLGITIASSLPSIGQGEAALPFLLLSPSTEANGMGGTSIALRRFDPTSIVFSPAQAGISALESGVRFGLYPATGSTLAGAYFPDLEYRAWGASAGLLLNDLIQLPFRVGIGLAYHRVENDMGEFLVTDTAGPETRDAFEAYEIASGCVFGVGIDYLVRLGFGYTIRSIESHLAPIGVTLEQGPGSATVNAYDYGLLLEAPLISVIEELTGADATIGGQVHPFFGLSAGTAWNNIGDRVAYVDPAQADPFPRTARTGIALQGGLCLPSGWELLAGAWSREAEDLLVLRRTDGNWEYQSGLGDIQFGTNVLQGRLTENVSLRGGWQIEAAELFTYRTGSVEGSLSYDTWGYSVRLAGLLKGISHVAGDAMPEWGLFIRDHIDLQYHHATSTSRQPRSEKTSSSGVMLLFRLFPW